MEAVFKHIIRSSTLARRVKSWTDVAQSARHCWNTCSRLASHLEHISRVSKLFSRNDEQDHTIGNRSIQPKNEARKSKIVIRKTIQEAENTTISSLTSSTLQALAKLCTRRQLARAQSRCWFLCAENLLDALSSAQMSETVWPKTVFKSETQRNDEKSCQLFIGHQLQPSNRSEDLLGLDWAWIYRFFQNALEILCLASKWEKLVHIGLRCVAICGYFHQRIEIVLCLLSAYTDTASLCTQVEPRLMKVSPKQSTRSNMTTDVTRLVGLTSKDYAKLLNYYDQQVPVASWWVTSIPDEMEVTASTWITTSSTEHKDNVQKREEVRNRKRGWLQPHKNRPVSLNVTKSLEELIDIEKQDAKHNLCVPLCMENTRNELKQCLLKNANGLTISMDAVRQLNGILLCRISHRPKCQITELDEALKADFLIDTMTSEMQPQTKLFFLPELADNQKLFGAVHGLKIKALEKSLALAIPSLCRVDIGLVYHELFVTNMHSGNVKMAIQSGMQTLAYLIEIGEIADYQRQQQLSERSCDRCLYLAERYGPFRCLLAAYTISLMCRHNLFLEEDMVSSEALAAELYKILPLAHLLSYISTHVTRNTQTLLIARLMRLEALANLGELYLALTELDIILKGSNFDAHRKDRLEAFNTPLSLNNANVQSLLNNILVCPISVSFVNDHGSSLAYQTMLLRAKLLTKVTCSIGYLPMDMDES
ncbi:hypothetical protein EG68_02191 [Paragonimus skrjabini miyazakii]|uniref:Uncharacterized protein n=1 Tax=Paragonimus skrjabini miyazakii TaxID=59628 RepID=A0A8S9YZ74_9TREM|nr:hypothetical protein EG68_02191 [Paragonimus skrjabini miyazakii]